MFLASALRTGVEVGDAGSGADQAIAIAFVVVTVVAVAIIGIRRRHVGKLR